MPGGKAFAELLTIERSAKQMSLERKVLPDRAEARQEHLGAFRIAKATHAALAFTGRLMTVFGPVVQPSAGPDEDMLDVFEFGNLGLCCWIATRLIGHDLARCLGTGGQHALEKPLGCCLIATLLKQNIKLGVVLIDGSPQQIRLVAQRYKDLVQMPCGAGLATRSLDAMREARVKFIAPTPNRLIADDHPTLEQQLFNVAQTQLKPEVPPNSAADDRRGKLMTVIKRFRILHQTILRGHPNNVTKPSGVLAIVASRPV
jgi:hypothetical protein